MMDILFSNRKSMFFYWNCVQASWQVFGDYIPKMNSKKANPLKALIEEELILPEDRNIFQIYLTRIEKGLQEGMPEDSLEIQCHVKSREGYQWYKINCRFRKDEQDRIMEAAGFLEPMSAIEIMVNGIFKVKNFRTTERDNKNDESKRKKKQPFYPCRRIFPRRRFRHKKCRNAACCQRSCCGVQRKCVEPPMLAVRIQEHKKVQDGDNVLFDKKAERNV